MKYDELVEQIHELDVSMTKRAASAVNVSLNIRNWIIGGWIVHYEQDGSDRAQYGEKLLSNLADGLSSPGLRIQNLKSCRRFYINYREIGQTVSVQLNSILGSAEKGQTLSVQLDNSIPSTDKSATLLHKFQLPELTEKNTKGQTVSAKSVPSIDPEVILTRLSFSQIVELLKIEEPLQRRFYEIEAIKGNWSVRELKRQIGSLLYERTGFSKDKERLIQITNACGNQLKPGDVIRDPYVFEFLNLPAKDVIEESDLEQALLDDLQQFLLELDRGFCFEARQKRIQIGTEYYFVDLVFYHRFLKCNILIDLKTRAFEHGDAGQLNTYVNYFSENEMSEGDQPPIGLLLCTAKMNPSLNTHWAAWMRTFLCPAIRPFFPRRKKCGNSSSKKAVAFA